MVSQCITIKAPRATVSTASMLQTLRPSHHSMLDSASERMAVTLLAWRLLVTHCLQVSSQASGGTKMGAVVSSSTISQQAHGVHPYSHPVKLIALPHLNHQVVTHGFLGEKLDLRCTARVEPNLVSGITLNSRFEKSSSTTG